MINSDSSFEEGQVLPTSDIFSEGVYAQVNIDRSVDSENVVESDKVITAPIAFSSAPGKTAYLRTLHRKKPPPYAKQSRGLVPKVWSGYRGQHLGRLAGGVATRPERAAGWRRGRLRTRRGRRRKADRSL
jgi:hypothetical protein